MRPSRLFHLFLMLSLSTLASCAGGGGHPGSPSCGPSSCEGCCDDKGTCRAGGGPLLCGAGGAACAACLPTCDGGACSGGPDGGAPSTDDGGVPSCGALTSCGLACVDTGGDRANCGACGKACGSSESCVQGQCKVPSCAGACTGATYCDAASGQCKSGCERDAQCGASQTCDLASHACRCAAVDQHVCGGACVLNSAPATCGDRCSPCPAPTNGAVGCDGSRCIYTCGTGFHACASGCCPWQITPLSGVDAMTELSATTDSTGAPHLVYYASNDGIRYGKPNGTTLSSVLVEKAPYIQRASIAVDAAGTVHIVYGTSAGVRYARSTGGPFTVTTLVSQSDGDAAVALDANGRLRVVYLDHGDVKLTEQGASGWTTTTITTALAREPSVAVDGMGRAHVGWEQGRVVYAAPGAAPVGLMTAYSSDSYSSVKVAVSASGAPHAGYCKYTSSIFGSGTSLWGYLRLRNGQWSNLPPSAGSFSPHGCTNADFALDPAGNARAVFSDSSSDALIYVESNGVNLRYDKLASTPGNNPGTGYSENAIAVDSAGNPHIFFRDGTTGVLRYAR